MAIADFTKRIADNPGVFHVLKRRGWALIHLGRFREGLADVQEAVRLGPDDLTNLNWYDGLPKIVKCSDAGVRERYLALVEQAVRLNHESGTVRIKQAWILFHFGKLDEARAKLHAILKSRDASYYDWYQSGLLSLLLGEDAAYRKVCEEMVSQFAATENPEEAYFVAWTCALAADAIKEYDGAIALAKRAAEEAPSDRRLIALGAILYRAGRWEEALESLTSIDRVPTTGQLSPAYGAFFLAMTQRRLGPLETAQTSLELANQLAEKEFANPASTYRRVTLELLRDEANACCRDLALPEQPKSSTSGNL